MGHQTLALKTKEAADRAGVIKPQIMKMMNFREPLKSPKRQQKLRNKKEKNLHRRKIQTMISILEKILNSLRPTISLQEVVT